MGVIVPRPRLDITEDLPEPNEPRGIARQRVILA